MENGTEPESQCMTLLPGLGRTKEEPDKKVEESYKGTASPWENRNQRAALRRTLGEMLRHSSVVVEVDQPLLLPCKL